ncbi:MAG: RCC1 domain-containing protein [Treponema sp.]|nr:RCC1 domain-containing protein [Treponema sp.]
MHTAAIQSDGSLWAWGNNEYGQLGINSTNDSLVPLREHSNSTWRVYPVK